MSKHLLSQLTHVEILSPRPAETVAFLSRDLKRRKPTQLD